MIIFDLAISAKHRRVGQTKPGFPHFADGSGPGFVTFSEYSTDETVQFDVLKSHH